MRLLLVIDDLGSGGAQRQLVGLAVAFKKQNITVFFLTYHTDNFYKHLLDDNDIPVEIINKSNNLQKLFGIRNYIRKGNFDAVLSFLDGANFMCQFSAIPYKKWKLVVGERNANPLILKSFKLIVFRWFHFFSNFVVANSYKNIEIVKKVNPLLSNKKLKVLYNIIDTNYWTPSDAYKYDMSSGKKFKLLIAARHQKQKNIIGLINGVNSLDLKDKKKLVIDWYGDEHENDNTLTDAKKMIKKFNLSNNFNFYPATTDIRSKIQSADAVGLFSFFEGFPNFICEGMACAKPVVASAVSDIPLILSSENGFLCNPNDKDSIAEALSKTINLTEIDLLKMGKANRKNIICNFNSEKIVDEYLKLLNLK